MTTRGEGIERQVAAVSAVVFNVLVVALLLRMGGPAVLPQSDDGALRVVWIERTPVTPPANAPSAPAVLIELEGPSHSARRAQSRKVTASTATTPIEPVTVPGEHDAVAVLADDTWPEAAMSRRSDADTGMFQESAFGPRAPHLDKPRRVPVFRMQDASLGGRLGRMAHVNACRELRAALGNHPASAEVILRTMQERGCRQ